MHETMIKKAIKARHVVHIRRERDTANRVFAPHVMYRSSEGSVMVGGVQIYNPSRPAERADWRSFVLSQIHHVAETMEVFAVARNFDRDARMYSAGIITDVRVPH